MRFIELRHFNAQFEASGKKSLYATCVTDDLGLDLIEHDLKAKIRHIVSIKKGVIKLELRECDNIETELNRQKAFLGLASLNISRDEDVCSFLSIFSDAIYLVVLCEKKLGKHNVIDELLKHIKDPICSWSGYCVVDGEAFESARDENVFLLGVSRLRFDFRIEHQPAI